MFVRRALSRTLSVVFIVAIFSVCLNTEVLPQGAVEDWANADGQKIWGLMQTWAAVKYNFAYFDQVPDLDWDAEVQSRIPRVLAARDRDEYYQILRELTVLLNDGHTTVLPPSVIRGELENPPLEFQMIQDKIVLARVGDTAETQAQHLRPGLELVEVGDGVPAREYLLENALRYYSGGTKQWGEAFGMYFFLGGERDTSIRMKFKDSKGRTIPAELTRGAVNTDGPPFRHRMFDFPPFVEVRMLEDGIVYFRLASFASDQAVTEFDAEFERLDLAEVRGMILDVRFNMGGNSDHAFGIVSRLIEEPV